jgi:hypothetical protein
MMLLHQGEHGTHFSGPRSLELCRHFCRSLSLGNTLLNSLYVSQAPNGSSVDAGNQEIAALLQRIWQAKSAADHAREVLNQS